MENRTGNFIIRIGIGDVLAFLIFITPIMRYYNFFSTGIGMEMLLTLGICVISVLLFLSSPKYNLPELRKSRAWFAIFCIWAAIITLFFIVFEYPGVQWDGSFYNTQLFMIINMISLYFILYGCGNSNHMIKMYEFFIWLLVFIYILQWILLGLGLYISFKIPFMEASSAWQSVFSRKIYFGMEPWPTALFSEKSHMCQYFLPYIAICLYSENLIRKKRIVKAIIASIVVLSTVSGNGVIVILVEWIGYSLFKGSAKKTNKILTVITGVLLVGVLSLLLSKIPRFADMFSILFTSDKTNVMSKADYRIYRGFDIFTKLPLTTKFTGVGNYMMQLFSNNHSIISQYDNSYSAYEYFSALFQTLLYFGCVGLALFAKHMISLFKTHEKVVMGLIIMMSALWVSTEMVFSSFHIMYMYLIVNCLKMEKQLDSKLLC